MTAERKEKKKLAKRRSVLSKRSKRDSLGRTEENPCSAVALFWPVRC
jgi:hypothetical protein